MVKFKLFCFGLLFIASQSFAQPTHYTTANGHSHNDYEQALPFYGAYARHFGSIEADIWAVNGKLMVAHDKAGIRPDRTFKNLYLHPLLKRLKVNNGKAYRDGQPLQLLIDLKSSYSKTLPLLKKTLAPYYSYFDLGHNPNAIRIVISGEMPPPDSLRYFDPVFTFDGRIGNQYAKKDMQRVVLISANVQKFVDWEREQPLQTSEFERLKNMVDSIHQQKKLIRFWGTPNTSQAYQTLMSLGVDYIGSDKLQLLACLLNKSQ